MSRNIRGFYALWLFMCAVATVWGGRTRIKSASPDGVNIVTTEVDERGNVESVSTTTAHVPERYIPASGDRVAIGDYEYVMVRVEDWRDWTNAVERLKAVAERRWANEHKTEAGRVAWHGKRTGRRLSEDGRRVTFVYADGYEHTEEAPPAPRTPSAVKAQKLASALPPQKTDKSLPPRLRAKRDALAARHAATNEVNIVFGAGGKVLEVRK